MLEEAISNIESGIKECEWGIAQLYLLREASALADDREEVARLNGLIDKERQSIATLSRNMARMLAFKPHFESNRDEHLRAMQELLKTQDP